MAVTTATGTVLGSYDMHVIEVALDGMIMVTSKFLINPETTVTDRNKLKQSLKMFKHTRDVIKSSA